MTRFKNKYNFIYLFSNVILLKYFIQNYSIIKAEINLNFIDALN